MCDSITIFIAHAYRAMPPTLLWPFEAMNPNFLQPHAVWGQRTAGHSSVRRHPGFQVVAEDLHLSHTSRRHNSAFHFVAFYYYKL